MKISTHIEEWDLQQPFRISGQEWRSARCVVVEIEAQGCVGRGEGHRVYYVGETIETMVAQIDGITDSLRKGISREDLLQLMPSGGARNAVDCALWDLEAKRTGKSIWELTGIDPKPVTTVYTIGLEDTPEQMGANAKAASRFPVLKIKLNDDRPVERLQAIRRARPDAKLVVDANQGWNFELLQEVLRRCAELDISMVEQPLPRGDDASLEGFKSPVILAADESCLDTSEMDVAIDRYDMINIKLDKTGGLTEALRLARAAREKGCKLMVGNMIGTSLSMAPSFVIAQLCDFVDIDGPLLLKYDRLNRLEYRDAQVEVFDSSVWG